MTTQDKPAVGPLSAGDLVQHVVAKNMFRVIRRIDGEWPDVWLNMVGEPHQAHMADRWVFVGRPGPDGWMPWSGGEPTITDPTVDIEVRLRNGELHVDRSPAFDWTYDPEPHPFDIIAFRLAPTAPVEETPQSLAQAFEDAMEGSHGAWAVSGDEDQPSGETREVDEPLKWFLKMIEAAGGRIDSSDTPHNPINVFCDDRGEGTDTFNLSEERGYTHTTHDSDFDISTTVLTDQGRAILALITPAERSSDTQASSRNG